MTQERRITDKLPGQPLQWDDNAGAARAASPSAAPAAGQAGLAKPEDIKAAFESWAAKDGTYDMRPAKWKTISVGGTPYDGYVRPYLQDRTVYAFQGYSAGYADGLAAAPAAADTEQARDAARYRFLRDKKSSLAERAPYIARDCANSHFRPAWIHGEDADKIIDAAMGAAPLATPADAGADEQQLKECAPPFAAPAGQQEAALAVLSAVRDGIPLQEPVSITGAVLAQREARAVLGVGTGPKACAMLVNIQLTPWKDGAETAEAFVSGYNTAMKWFRAALVDLADKADADAASRCRAQGGATINESGQSPAPVTAEPAQSIDTPEFRMLEADFVKATIDLSGKDHHADNAELYAARTALIAHINRRLASPAPADRDAIREAYELAAKACEGERVEETGTDGDKGYNTAIEHCAAAIRALKSMERAADAKGEQQ